MWEWSYNNNPMNLSKLYSEGVSKYTTYMINMSNTLSNISVENMNFFNMFLRHVEDDVKYFSKLNLDYSSSILKENDNIFKNKR